MWGIHIIKLVLTYRSDIFEKKKIGTEIDQKGQSDHNVVFVINISNSQQTILFNYN